MPEGSVAPIVQVTDQGQPIYITEGFANGIQILDGSIPFIQSSDGTSIIQLAAPSMVSGGNMEGLTQVGIIFLLYARIKITASFTFFENALKSYGLH